MGAQLFVEVQMRRFAEQERTKSDKIGGKR